MVNTQKFTDHIHFFDPDTDRVYLRKLFTIDNTNNHNYEERDGSINSLKEILTSTSIMGKLVGFGKYLLSFIYYYLIVYCKIKYLYKIISNIYKQYIII